MAQVVQGLAGYEPRWERGTRGGRGDVYPDAAAFRNGQSRVPGDDRLPEFGRCRGGRPLEQSRRHAIACLQVAADAYSNAGENWRTVSG